MILLIDIEWLSKRSEFLITIFTEMNSIHVFFFIVYDVSGTAHDRNCVVLNEIHIDIMDYIMPGSCTDSEFRQMWAEFEWENKVNF